MPEHTNRLVESTSPYLLQHASNPVDWYPWGEEAFAAARERNVPIFLSIGYSTCYWCHVMERESFESEATARVMNDRFVCIKLDREERPDVDDLYMTATQAMTGRGGWPMSVFLEPNELKPFYCGTYFPPEPRHGMPSFQELLIGMSNAWAERHDEVVQQSQRLADAVEEQLVARERPVKIGAEQVQQAVGTLLKIADMQHGGFGGAPKFPQPAYVDFLLEVREAADEPTKQAIDGAVRLALDEMLKGGIHDHVGGGFHRYSVDAFWTVPHFEKMLYDNGQLAATYARAAELYSNPAYRRAAERTCGYVLRDMTAPEGGFFSAQDAEVDHREGLNYLWTPDEIRQALGDEDAEFANQLFGLDAGTNFQDPHHPDEPASNVLRLESVHGAETSQLDRVCNELLNARDLRKQPGTDDKVLAAWNGIMLRGLAATAMLTDNPRYLEAAERACSFVQQEMISGESGLLRAWREGKSHTPAFLDDHANLIVGLAAVGRAQQAMGRDDSASRRAAQDLAEHVLAAFVDKESGTLYDTRAGEADLFARGRSTYDGATPSAVATMLNAWIDLAELTGSREYLDQAIQSLVAHSAAIHASPIATVHSTRALFRLLRSGAALEAAFAEAHAVEVDSADVDDVPQPVEIYANLERVSISDGTPAEIQILLRVKPGFHIIAADPGTPFDELTPLRVSVVGGTGVSAYADYPQGEPLDVPGIEDPVLVHSGDVELSIAIERAGERSGRPMLVVSYQACSELECMLPQSLELDVAIDID